MHSKKRRVELERRIFQILKVATSKERNGLKMNFKSKLSNKILPFVIISFIAIISLVLSITLMEVNDYNTNNSKEQALKGVKGLEMKIEELKQTSSMFTSLSAENESIKNAILHEFSLNNALKSINKTDFLYIADIEGNLIEKTGINSNINKLNSNISFKKAITGDSVTTIESDIISKLSVTSFYPIKSGNKVIAVCISGFALDKTEIVDEIKEVFETDITIFSGNTRINTTIIMDDIRQIGTELSEEVTNIVIEQGNEYSGEADILGINYITAYKPLKNNNNEIVGVLFAGEPLTDAEALINNIRNLSFIISVSSNFLMFIILYIYFKKTITTPLKKIAEASGEIADGNLSINVDVKSKDEIGFLANAFREMIKNLSNLIGKVNESSTQIAKAARELESSSSLLSQGSVEQAASVEQLSSSATEILEMTKQNAEAAKKASDLSQISKDICVDGNTKMQELLEAINSISESSGKISKIIKVIDDIAFQTNILALNAAVEAAQAGQYGKGFAVVADNVKDLAQRSARAAKEIAEMIDDSVVKSKIGTEVANKTAETLFEIINQINELDSMFTSIYASTEEQSSGISQINSGISKISEVLQTNSSMSEESSASSTELLSQANALKEQISTFKLDDNQNSESEDENA